MGYCVLCKTTQKMMTEFRLKLTKVMLCLILMQLAILTLYAIEKYDLLIDHILVREMELEFVYALFVVELLINSAVLYGRYENYKDLNKATDEFAES